MAGWTIRRLADREVSVWQTPRVWIRVNSLIFRQICGSNGVGEILRHAAVRSKHVGSNMPVDWIPIERVDAAALFVQGNAESTFFFFYRDASLVQPLMRIVHVAVRCVSHGHIWHSRLFVGDLSVKDRNGSEKELERELCYAIKYHRQRQNNPALAR